MVIPPDLGSCLRFNSDAIDRFRLFSPRRAAEHAAERGRRPAGE